MRVQNISFNNYSNKKTNQNPAFKANVYSVVKATCRDGDLCELALMKLSSLFTEAAIKSGKIKPENAVGVHVLTGKNGYADLLLLDRTTSLHDEISSIEDPELLSQHIELAPFDEETEEIEFSVEEKDVCPGLFIKNLLEGF